MESAISPKEEQLLLHIIGAKRAWTSAAKLKRIFGEETLSSLSRGGWIECWDFDAFGKPLKSRSWTLTPWGAALLNVELDELEKPSGQILTFWVKLGMADGPIRVHAMKGTERLGFPELLPDPKSTPRYLMGVPVKLDPRLSKKKAKPCRRRKPEKVGHGKRSGDDRTT